LAQEQSFAYPAQDAFRRLRRARTPAGQPARRRHYAKCYPSLDADFLP